MDFADSPDEAAFRADLREWAQANNPRPAAVVDRRRVLGRPGRVASLAVRRRVLRARRGRRRSAASELPSVYDVILDEELAAGRLPAAPVARLPRAGHPRITATPTSQARFLPGIVSGRERWCQGFSEPDAGSDLASLRTRAERDGDDYVITGHKVWTSYSDDADWCLVLARTDPDAPKHKGISAFIVAMHQPGIEQRPLKMINGITKEFGEVIFDGARVPAANMIGAPGDGWRLAMTVVSHEREPGELGFVARYRKTVHQLVDRVAAQPDAYDDEQRRELAWAIVESEMLRHHVSRRLSDRLDGITHGPEGSVDKLLMTWTEQTVGHAALDDRAATTSALATYLYSRAQSVMGGTSQIQRNLIATRILELPTS